MHQLLFLLLLIAFCDTRVNITPKISEIFGSAPTLRSGQIQRRPHAKTSTSSDTDCICVLHSHCTKDRRLLIAGRNFTDPRTGTDEDIDYRCKDPMEWCCVPERPEMNQVECGQRNPEGVGFRRGVDDESNANFGEFPWTVAVLYATRLQRESLISYQCGGTLIHPRAVVTAAHCVADARKTFLIRAGEWDTHSTKEIHPHQDRYAKSIVIHPEFLPGGLFNDIAFIFLDAPVDMTQPNVGVACLPQQGAKFSKGTRCFATGWGKDKQTLDGKYETILKKIDLPIMERAVCQDLLRKTRLGRYFKLDESFVCAGGEPAKYTCKGDGGSPLVCPIPGKKGRYQQVGIVSWGICCDYEVPGAYTNVALFRNWIDQQFANYNLDKSAYSY